MFVPKEDKLQKGILWLGFCKLTDSDFKRILAKVASKNRRERRPRKCRRYGDHNVLSKILSNIPSCPIRCFNVVGNVGIGDAGMQHLHMLPDSIVDLDLSDCGITAEGVECIVKFLARNKSITRFIMWGNPIGEKGAQWIAAILLLNDTLRELCVMKCGLESTRFVSYFSMALEHNNTLRNLSTGMQDFTLEDVRCLANGLALNNGLDELDLCSTNITEEGVAILADSMEHNHFLERLILTQPDDEERYVFQGHGTPYDRLQYWLKLNQLDRWFLTQDSTCHDRSIWLDSMSRASAAGDIDMLYFFLRNKPEYVPSSSSSPYNNSHRGTSMSSL